VWSYEQFSGKIGGSDVAGTVQVDLARERPALSGEVSSKLLDIADLGPALGATETKAQRASGNPRVLPDVPFDTERWDSVDANVAFRAGTLRRAKELPLHDVDARIRMEGAVLTIEQLRFNAAGGRVTASLRMDAREEPLAAKATVRAQGIEVEQILQSAGGKLEKAGIGHIDAVADLTGSGNSIARVLGSANGKVGVVVPAGEISGELMAMLAIDLWRIAKFKLEGDEPVKVRCGVGDFEVKNGVMRTNALVFDTEAVNVQGTGTIDLRRERIDLTLYPEPKLKSVASLRTPLYVSGPLAKPSAGPDKGRLAVKGLGAVVLGAVAPLLAVIPLVDTGPGADSNCNLLVQQAKALPGKEPPQAQANQPAERSPRS